MKVEHTNLLKLIREFQSAVARAAALFQQHRGFSNISQWREHGMSMSGTVDAAGVYRYYFHGIGCAFHFEDGSVVDWDWGHDGRIDGFDEWRLRGFWETRPHLRALFPDESSIKQAFDSAVAAGLLVSPWRGSYDSLYYLPEDIHTT